MNILFLLGRYPGFGGVETVTTDLANIFTENGHKVSIASFDQPDYSAIDGILDKRVKIVELAFSVSLKSNLKILREWIERNKIDIIINQWAVPWYVARFIRRANKNQRAKIITVHHNQPDTNARIEAIKIEITKGNKTLLNKLRLRAVTLFSRLSLRYVYSKSDKFLVLSPSYISILSRYIFKRNCEKAIVQCNPVKLVKCADVPKENEVICVGRIEYNQKRTYRLLSVWEKISALHPDWKLTFVGNGPDEADLRRRIAEMNLHNVTVTGFVDPTPYYQRAKILAHVAEYEGLALIFAESMNFGVVAVALNSFSSLNDIIPNDSLGIKVSYPYDEDVYVEELLKLIENEDVRSRMSEMVKTIPPQFSIDKIYNDWEKLFQSIKKPDNQD